jgi:hypothetical protein
MAEEKGTTFLMKQAQRLEFLLFESIHPALLVFLGI